MRNAVRTTIAVLLLVPLAACTEQSTGDQAKGNEAGGRRTFDLRPRWEPGVAVHVREEREEMTGRGPFPPAGDLEKRADQTRREVHVYRVEPLRADGTRLKRARMSFTTSARGPRGALTPTAIAGKTYEITDPFLPGSRVEIKGTDGEFRDAPQAEVRLVRQNALLMAASLIPGRQVAIGEGWAPGRNMQGMALSGMRIDGMVPRLKAVRPPDGPESLAEVECISDLVGESGPNANARATMRETVRIDLTAGRVASYQMVREGESPPTHGRPKMWHRVVVDMTLSKATKED